MMLLSRIHHLKNKIEVLTNTFFENKKDIVSTKNKNSELEKRISSLEEFIKTQNFLNESLMNQIKVQERERIKVVKDIQIIVATLKDVYTLVQNSAYEYEFFDDEVSKKKKKNNTFH